MAGLLASGVELKVTPERLVEKSETVEKKIEKVKRHFETLQTLVSKSQGYWLGEAGELYRQKYKDQEANVESILNRLMEHPADLKTIAQTYMGAESAVQQIIESLPGDVLL